MHFSDLGSDSFIRKAFSEVEKQKFIRRLARGLSGYTKKHDTLGTLPPDLNEVAKAIAEKDEVLIQSEGVHAANLVGISSKTPRRKQSLTYCASEFLVPSCKVPFRLEK